MHYYGFSIDSYVAKTRHLTPMEDLAYRRMLDHYYGKEKPLQGDAAAIARLIGLRKHVAEVEQVLAEFFRDTTEGWLNDRAEEELADYRKKVEAASKAGKASGEWRRNGGERPLNGRSTDVQRTLNGRSTDVQRPSNGRSTDVQRPSNERATTEQRPSNERATNQESESGISTTPTPPFGGAGSGPIDPAPEPKPEPPANAASPIADLTTALFATGLRSGANAIRRRGVLREIAESQLPSGLTPANVEALWLLARAKSNDDPGGLLDEWLVKIPVGMWRGVLDDQAMKAKQTECRTRTDPAADPLAGVYGGS